MAPMPARKPTPERNVGSRLNPELFPRSRRLLLKIGIAVAAACILAVAIFIMLLLGILNEGFKP